MKNILMSGSSTGSLDSAWRGLSRVCWLPGLACLVTGAVHRVPLVLGAACQTVKQFPRHQHIKSERHLCSDSLSIRILQINFDHDSRLIRFLNSKIMFPDNVFPIDQLCLFAGKQ